MGAKRQRKASLAGATTGNVPWWKPKPLEPEELSTVVTDIVAGASSTRRFYILLTLSTTIAALGLLANSAAVIIGAMIIAPLMGPILGLALGMISANHVLERKAILAETTGVLLAILLGYAIGRIPINPGISAEMLARTSPTVLDLGIAFASGLAGGFASVNRKVNSALAGVAISVALVPPLATCGLLLAMNNLSGSWGAFLLFLANFFCIQTAAAMVFWMFGLQKPHIRSDLEVWRYRLRFAPGIVAVLLMGWFMTGTLISLVRDHDLENRITDILSKEVARRTGGKLDEILERGQGSGGYRVVASVLTPRVFAADQVRQVESVLQSQVRDDLVLVVRSVVSQDMDRKGRVYLTHQERESASELARSAEFLASARTELLRVLEEHEGAALDTLERLDENGNVVLVAAIHCPSPLTADAVGRAEDRLQATLGQPVRLIVRSIRTMVMDRNGSLFTPSAETTAAPDPELAAHQERILSALHRRMSAGQARNLISSEVSRRGRVIFVSAVVEATQPITPDEVAAIEADMRRFIHPGISVSIRTELAARAESGGWR